MINEQLQKQLTELSNSQEKTTLNPSEYADIELTDEEKKEALRRGREKKYFQQRQEDYWRQIHAATILHRPSARELFENLKNTKSAMGDRFQVVDWNSHVISDLCLYFAGDPRFEVDGRSLRKGIFLTGPQGTGKTHLLSFFMKNPHQSYRTVTTKMIAEQYAQKWSRDDQDALQFYSRNQKMPSDHAGTSWNQAELGYCFGDLGTEPTRKQFGNETNVMEHIIFQRYENQVPFNMTHFTTNLNADEIEANYGVRIRDRIREMCNWIVLDGPSWRK